tara:strand:- start:485 stop:1159 length:675 start_codon:yes stop_codon:yes gene_type:complete
MDRRYFLILTSAPLLVGIPSVGLADRSKINFDIFLNNNLVGYSNLTCAIVDEGLEILIDVEIIPKFLGLKLLKYTLKNREVWSQKKLISIDSKTSWFGKQYYVKGRKIANGFEVNGSAFSGLIKEKFATTSYFTPEFLKRRIWLSSQDGTPLTIETKKMGTSEIVHNNKKFKVTDWKISGDLELTLQYDNEGHWVGSGFSIGKYPANFRLNSRTKNIHKLWKKN